MKKALLSFAMASAFVMTGMANDYTFVFDGNNDMGGLTRQTSTKESDLTFTDSFSLNEEGIELSMKKISEKGFGFALINAGGNNAGLCVYSSFYVHMTPEITLTVPNGKITSVTLTMSGTGLTSVDIPFNGTEVEGTVENSMVAWTWKDNAGVETVSCTWDNNYYARYIHSIKVVYTPDLGGKQECGLSFASDSFEAVIGEKFTSPTLTNPNKLSVAWSSTDENVATVDEQGKVTLIGGGKTTIAASTEGNEEYAKGNAKYVLTVIPSADNILQLKEFAPKVYDRIKVNFPATVTFATGGYAFVVDSEGNAACFYDTKNQNSAGTVQTIYKVGNVIPAGWIATNATIYESFIWEGRPGNVTENVEVVYPEVTSVTPEDVDRVVILKNVTFDKTTPIGNTKVYGTTPDNTSYEFQDTYDAPYKPAGTYDVTCVVKYSKVGTRVYFYLAPIAYTESDDPSIVVDATASEENACYYDLSGKKVSNPNAGVYVKVVNDKASKVVVK